MGINHVFLDSMAGNTWDFETLLAKPNVDESVILDDKEYVITKIVHDVQSSPQYRIIRYYVTLVD